MYYFKTDWKLKRLIIDEGIPLKHKMKLDELEVKALAYSITY